MIEACSLMDIKSAGASWTWENKHSGNTISRKLDRVLVNEDWYKLFPNSFALSKLFNLSDPIPYLIHLEKNQIVTKKMFKCFILPYFKEKLEEWNQTVVHTFLPVNH